MASTKGEPRTQNTSKTKRAAGSSTAGSREGSSAGRRENGGSKNGSKAKTRNTSKANSSKVSGAYPEEERERERRNASYREEEEGRREQEEGLFPFFREICALLAFGFCVLLFLGLIGKGGKAGEILALISHGLFGTVVSWVLPIVLFFSLLYIIYRWYERITWIRISGMVLVLLSFSTLFQVIFTKREELEQLSYFEGITTTPGGFFGVLGTHLFMFLCGKAGAVIIVLILMIIGILLLTGLSVPGLVSMIAESARDRREEDEDRRREQSRRASLRENTARERKKPSDSDREGRDSRDYWESRNQKNNPSAKAGRSTSFTERDQAETAGSPIQGYPREMFAAPEEEEKPKKKGKKGSAAVSSAEPSDTSGLNIFGLDGGKPINEPVPEEKPQTPGYGYGASFRKEETAPLTEQAAPEEENFPDSSMFKKPEEAKQRPVYGSSSSRVSHPSYQEPGTKDPSAVEVSASDNGIVVMSKQTASARRMSYEGPIFNEMEAFAQDMGKTDPDVVPPPPIRPQLKPKRDNRTLSELSSLDRERGVDGSGYEYGESATDAFARRHSLSGKTPVESSFATESFDASPIGEEAEEGPDLEATADLNDEDFAGGWMSLPEEYDENGTRTVVTSTGKRISHKSGFLPGERGLSSADSEKTVAALQEGKGKEGSEGSGKSGSASKAAAQAPSSVVSKKPEKKQVEYRFPPLNLLEKAQGGRDTRKLEQTLRDTAAKLEATLSEFGVGAKVSNITCGPTVTRYELIPEPGVRVSKILTLSDDIKLNLAAQDIRIEAPIPGKSAIGIEVPNPEKMPVSLRELLESDAFKHNNSPLAFAVGKDIAGASVVADLGKMPHLLIAGSTGSGKSVCVNTMILSLIYHAKPSDVKMIMIDPKVVELSVYNGIPHLLIPVVTNPDQAAGALNWAVAEMDRRYNEFAKYGVRDLKGYNQKIDREFDPKDPEKPSHMSYIVVIIDELADLMMVAPGEVEDAIIRLAQKARAAGIHLIIATQRPSVNVITGLIKANIPSRIAFAVTSGTDSRTILDTVGAEKLLGKGDMLYFPSGLSKPLRVQGAFESDEEVARVTDYLKDLKDVAGGEQAEINLNMTSSKMNLTEDGMSQEIDELFVQAGRFVIEKDKASSGMLQRMFRIGFNRAARILDQLYDAGVVGEEEGTKPRKVLMTEEEFEQYISNL